MDITVDQFMNALSGQESGGDYTATNGRTGAYGRFQIMPANWPAWSKEAGLGPSAPQTPENQEKVARFKLQQYYNSFGNWEDVASAWYSGRPRSAFSSDQLNRKQGNGNEPSISEYVNSVMGRLGGGTGGTSMAATPTMDVPIPKLSDFTNDPIEGTAQEQYLAALAKWGQLQLTMQQLNDPGQDPAAVAAQTDFDNRTSQFNSKIAFDQANVQTAAQALSRWLSGLQESRGRADMVTDAQDKVMKYGTQPGKNEFSYKDLGRDLFASKMGLDPKAISMRYGGTQTLDPRGILDSFDTQLGVSGPLPQIPNMLTTPEDIPTWARAAMGGGTAGGASDALGTIPGTSVPDVPASGGGFDGAYTAPPMNILNYPQQSQSFPSSGFDWNAPVTLNGAAPKPTHGYSGAPWWMAQAR